MPCRPPYLPRRPGGGARPSDRKIVQDVLYLTRKVGEAIIINDDIAVTVIEIRGKSVKLGFTFPPTATVLRQELYDRIQAENRAAAESGSRPLPQGLTLELDRQRGDKKQPG